MFLVHQSFKQPGHLQLITCSLVPLFSCRILCWTLLVTLPDDFFLLLLFFLVAYSLGSACGGATTAGAFATVNERLRPCDTGANGPPTLQLLIGGTRPSSCYLLPQTLEASFVQSWSGGGNYHFTPHSAATSSTFRKNRYERHRWTP